MSREQHNQTHKGTISGWVFSRTGFITLCALAILGFLIYTGHSAHLLGAVPYLLLLLCPLMHIFMHGHGGHHHGHDESSDKGDK